MALCCKGLVATTRWHCLMLKLLAAGSISTESMLHVGKEFTIQMAVGAVVGVIGGIDQLVQPDGSSPGLGAIRFGALPVS